MKYFFSTMLLCCLLFGTAWGQQRNLRGQVLSNDEREPLIGATIRVKNTQVGAVTDIDGRFSIQVSNGDVLLIGYTGFADQTHTVADGESSIEILLNAKSLNEVVVTALGISREKKALGYAVQQVSGQDIVAARDPNMLNALQGKTPGVLINSSSGAPGAGTNIIIRGINSLDPNRNNQPLFVIDGIPVSNQTNAGSVLPSSGSNAFSNSEQASFSNRAIDVNPNDIESISILKGPNATALYGLRASNGVVVITTKQGEIGKSRVDLNSSWGIDQIVKSPEYQDTYREGRFGRLRFNSDGSPLRFQSFGPKVFDGKTPVFDPIDEFFENGFRSDNSLTFSGGNNTARYSSSLGYSNVQGIIPFSEWDRISARLNGTIKISPKFSVGTSINYSNSGGNRPHSGDKSIMSALSYYTTSFSVLDYQNPDGTIRDFSDGIIDNPRYLAEFSSLKDNVNRIIGNMNFSWTPLSWLRVDYRIGGDNYTDARRRVIPPGLDVSAQVGGFLIEESISYRELTSNLTASTSHSLTDDLKLNFMLGHNLTDIQSKSLNTRGETFVLPKFYDLSNTTNFFVNSSLSNYRLVGAFGQAGLGWKDLLFLELTARNDWSSTLPKDNRSFLYGSANLSFVFSELLKSNRVLSYGKFRASLAQVGKDASPYQLGVVYNATPGFPFGNVTGFTQNSIAGDNGLQPERNRAIEFGTELRFFNNRIGLDFSWFKNNSKDMIISVPVSNATGFSRFITNAGEMENTGIELLLSATPVRIKNFEWKTGINYGSFSGKVIDIRDGIDEIVFFDNGYIVNKLIEGGKVGDLYGYKYNYHKDGQLLIGADGYPSIKDSFQLVGNALPDFTAGWDNTFQWKGLSLGVLLEWRHGGDVTDMGIRNSIRNGVIEETVRRHEQVVFNGVTADGMPNTKAVEIDGENLYRNFNRYNAMSEILLEDASWFRIRRVSLSYRLPAAWLGNKVSNAALTFSGNNLFINTPFRGFDPETNYLGSGSNAYGFTGLQTPGLKSYNLSLNLSF
jgi:TonB-linked SusC/RagA family outer membrane protein